MELKQNDGWVRVLRPGDIEWLVPPAWEVYGSDGFNRFLQAIKAAQVVLGLESFYHFYDV